jgi:hypothetical protein
LSPAAPVACCGYCSCCSLLSSDALFDHSSLGD